MSSSSSSSNSSSSSSISVPQFATDLKLRADSVVDDPAKTAGNAATILAANAMAQLFKDNTGATMTDAVKNALKGIFDNLFSDAKAGLKYKIDEATDNYPFTTTAPTSPGDWSSPPTFTLSAGPITWTNPQNTLSVNWDLIGNCAVNNNWSKANPINTFSAGIGFTAGGITYSIGGSYSVTVETPAGSFNNVWTAQGTISIPLGR